MKEAVVIVHRHLLLLLSLLSLPVLSSPARATDPPPDPPTANRVVNIDTAAIAQKGKVDGSVDMRFLSGDENRTIGSISLRYGVLSHLEAGIRATTGLTRSFTAENGSVIRYGGRDTEIYAKYGLPDYHGARFALQGGLSFPATPAQHNTTGTFGAMGEISLFDRAVFYVNPRAVFLDSNSLVGVGIGTSVRICDRVHLIGDWTPIVSGRNTISTVDATRARGDVWGVAVRLTTSGGGWHYDLDLGYSNAIGSTTGTSLTPSLGGSSGFYFALRARP